MNAPIKPVKLEALEFEAVTEMVSRREIASGAQRFVQTYLRKGAIVPLHAHLGDQWVMVQQGSLAIVVAGDGATIGEGEVVCIPAGTAHEMEALDDTLTIDVRTGETRLL